MSSLDKFRSKNGLKRARLRLVTDNDPGLNALRQEMPPVSTRRARSSETFARIPHARGIELARRKLSGAAWGLLIELDHMILMKRGQNPVELTRRVQKAVGLTRRTRTLALAQLERAGVIVVERRPGQTLLVRHTWFPASLRTCK